MKLHFNKLFIGIALLSLAFVACDKKEQIDDQQGLIIKDGKILLTAGYQPPVPDGKYTFNIMYRVCYFDAGDSVYINGVPYAVFPYDAGGDDESDQSSSWARFWVDTNRSGLYKGLYPKSAFSSQISDYENPTVIIPRRVKAINYNTSNAAVSVNAPVDGRVMPTTAFATTANLEDSMIFRNTIAMLRLKMRYSTNFARAIDPNASQDNGWPVITFDSVRFITPNHPLSGTGYIHNPYTTTPSSSEPLLVLNAGGDDTICYYFNDAVSLVAQAGDVDEPTSFDDKTVCFLPIIAMNDTPATVEVHFTARFNNGADTAIAKHYVYTKGNTLHSTRNMITTIFLNFLKKTDFTTRCREVQVNP